MMRLGKRLFRICALAAPVLVLTGGLPSTVLAQQPAPEPAEDAVTKLAREQFLAGIKAYDAGQWDQARLHFLQAYALKRHPAVLLNLGQSELKTGEYEAAGNHLQQFVREHEGATEAQKTSAREGIEEAQRRTGFVIMVVDQDGANLSIDGQAIGVSPLLGPYFVKPGTHQAAATKDGKVVRSTFVAERSKPASVLLNLGGAASPVPDPDPAPSPTPVPAALPEPGVPPAPYPQPGVLPYPQPGAGFDTGRQTTTSDDPITWFKERPGAWVGVGLFGAGVVGMIVAGAVAGDASSAADSVQDQILAEAADPSRMLTPKERETPCGPPDDTSGANDVAGFSSACNTLRENVDRRDASLIAVGVMGGIAGAALIGTVIYYFVDTADSGGSALVVSPTLGLERQGVSLSGSF